MQHEDNQRYIIQRIGPNPEQYKGNTYWNANIVAFDGQVFVISHRAILTIVVTASCNAACHFCSNEITFTPKGPYLMYSKALQRLKDLALLSGVSKIAFTGGEPTANPTKLYDLVKHIVPGFKRARVHTNGYGLFDEVETSEGKKPLLEALISAGLTGASVSVAHFDTTLNRQIMRFKTKWAGLDELTLSRIASYHMKAGNEEACFSPRLSCVMTLDGVKDVQDILDYIDWGYRLGFKKFIFRSPSGIPDQYSKSTEYTTYNRNHHIDINPITDALECLPYWREVFSQHKSDSHVHVYKVNNEITVDVDESSEEEDVDNKIRRLTCMPNSVVYTSWIDPRAYLFQEDRDHATRAIKSELPKFTNVLTDF